MTTLACKHSPFKKKKKPVIFIYFIYYYYFTLAVLGLCCGMQA